MAAKIFGDIAFEGPSEIGGVGVINMVIRWANTVEPIDYTTQWRYFRIDIKNMADVAELYDAAMTQLLAEAATALGQTFTKRDVLLNSPPR